MRVTAAAPDRTLCVVRALLVLGLFGTSLACKPPWVPGIDPRSLVEPGTGSMPDSALSTMMRDVIEALELDPCRVTTILAERTQTFDAGFEHYLTLSQRLADNLCAHNEPGVRILAAADGAPEWSPVLSVIQVQTTVWVQRSEPTTLRVDMAAASDPCPDEWVSEEYVIHGWDDAVLQLTAPPGYRVEPWVPGVARGCEATSEPAALEIGPDTSASFVVRGPEPARPLTLQVAPLSGPIGAVTYVPGVSWGTVLDLGYNTVSGSSFAPGVSCSGQFPEQPSVALRVPAGISGQIDLTLTSSGDVTLLVVSPTGQVFCDDDSGGGLDSMVRLMLSTGVWEIYAGSFDGDAITGAVLSYQ